MSNTAKTKLTDDEKRDFYRDGFVVLRNLISAELIETALSRYRADENGLEMMHATEFTDLINKSPLTPILKDAMGEFDPPTAARHIIRPPAQRPSKLYDALGYPEKDLPYFAANLHMDGEAVYQTPQERVEGTPEEIYASYIKTGRKGDIGRTAASTGVNYAPLFHDPEMTNSLGGFTTFIFVCLSDQTMEGGGQTNVLKGAHHAMEEFFRWQYREGKRFGPEGPGWPRLNHDVPNRCGYNHLPPAIYEQFTDETCKTTPDGRRWPRPTPVFMQPGDATIAMYHIPHCGTRNENGATPRRSPIFTLVNKKRHPNNVIEGHSDHPDRDWDGGYLDLPVGDNPFERSKFALCNMYHEWDGMQQIVAEERAKEGKSNAVFEL